MFCRDVVCDDCIKLQTLEPTLIPLYCVFCYKFSCKSLTRYILHPCLWNPSLKPGRTDYASEFYELLDM
jgi:hypothetical protein